MTRLRLSFLLLPTVLVGAVWLAGGCSETGSLPTEPTAPADPNAWQTIYPELATQGLGCIWGLDADDMWAGGGNGTLVHWDGERVTRQEFPDDRDITHLQGLARDDLWALARDLYRWDGRRWSLQHELADQAYAAHIVAEDDLYVGGRAQADTCRLPWIRHWDGRQWRDMPVPHLPDRNVYRIWRPSADHPLMASAGGTVLRLRDDGAWEAVYEGYSFLDVAGDLGLSGWGIWDTECRLYRFTTDGEVEALCPDRVFAGARALAMSRWPIIAQSNELRLLNGCETHPLADDLPGSIYQLGVPELPGSSGPAVFAVGYECLFLQGAWQPDGSFAWRDLVDVITNDIRPNLDGDAEYLFVDSDMQLLIRHDDTWSSEDLPFWLHGFRALGDGRVLLAGNDRLAVRERTGTLIDLPALPEAEPGIVWCDGTDGWAAADFNQLWRLAGGAWSPIDTIVTRIEWLDTDRADHVYVLADSRLLRHDGQTCTDLTAYPDVELYRVSLGRWTGHLYASGQRTEPYAPYQAVFDGEQWTEINLGDGGWEYVSGSIHEASADLVVLASDYHDFLLLEEGAWRPFDSIDDAGIEAVWGHPDRGLYVVTDDDRILRRPLPEVAR